MWIRGSRCSCWSGDGGSFVGAEMSEGGFHVAAEGMEGPDRAGVMTRPWVANMCSASSATAAMAAARSALNCLRSARRFAVTSSEVISGGDTMRIRYLTWISKIARTLSAGFSKMELSSIPARFTPRQIPFSEKSASPQDRYILGSGNPY